MMPNATIHNEPLFITPEPPAATETAILAAPPDMTKLSQPTPNKPHFSSLPISFSVEPIVKTYSVTPLTWILPKLYTIACHSIAKLNIWHKALPSMHFTAVLLQFAKNSYWPPKLPSTNKSFSPTEPSQSCNLPICVSFLYVMHHKCESFTILLGSKLR